MRLLLKVRYFVWDGVLMQWVRGVVLTCSFVVFLPGQAESLKSQIDGIIQNKLPHATVAVVVSDPDTDEVLYTRNAEKLLTPASTIKLYTAAAALYELGPDFQFDTVLSEKNNRLYLTFTGNPALTKTDLSELLGQLSSRFQGEIPGDLVIDTSRYEPPYHAPGISYDDLGYYYEAPCTALILDENMQAFELKTPKKFGLPVQISAKSNDKPLTLINQLVTVSQAQQKHHCSLNIEVKSDNTLRLYGCVAAKEYPTLLRLSIPDPILYAKQVIQQVLQEKNIPLKGRILVGKAPANAKTLAKNQSKPLRELMKHMLEESDNLYADSLTKQLGYRVTKQGSYKQGAFAIKQILRKHTKINMDLVVLEDGQGTRYNLVTPEQTATLLTGLYANPTYRDLFMDSLPRMSVSGTLKARGKETPLENRVFAKTGTMHDISALAGFLVLPNGKTRVFSIMINGVHGNIQQAKDLEEKILSAVVSAG